MSYYCGESPAGAEEPVKAVIAWLESVHRRGGLLPCFDCGRETPRFVFLSGGVYCGGCRPDTEERYTFDEMLLIFWQGLILLRNINLLSMGWNVYKERFLRENGWIVSEERRGDVFLNALTKKEKALEELNWLTPAIHRLWNLAEERGIEFPGDTVAIDLEVMTTFHKVLSSL